MAFVEFRDVRKVYAMGEVEVAAVDGMTFDVRTRRVRGGGGAVGAGKTDASEHARGHGRAHVGAPSCWTDAT